jgi:hypothetical protein
LARLTVLVLTGEDEAARLVALVVEEDHPGDRPGSIDHDSVPHAVMHPILVRHHHPQRAIRVDHIDALDGDSPRLRGGGGACRKAALQYRRSRPCSDLPTA